MKILVTGGCGFVGSHVAEFYASDAGNDVIVLDDLSRGRLLGKTAVFDYNRRFLEGMSNVEVRIDDVRDPAAVSAAVEGCDLVVHAAAQTAVTTSVEDPRTDFDVNARGTFTVLEAARGCANPPTVIFCSTNKVYGDRVNALPVESTKRRYRFAPGAPRGIPEDFGVDLCEHTPYGCSKLLGDVYVQDYARLYGLRTAVFRMSCIYGPRQFGVEDQGWLAWFTIAAATGRPVTIFGDGKQVRDVLYVKDLVRAFDAFHRSSAPAGVWNLGGGPANTLSLLELVDLLGERFGRPLEVSFADWRPSDQKVYISDISAVKRDLGFEPEISPSEGVGKLCDWVEENRALFEELAM